MRACGEGRHVPLEAWSKRLGCVIGRLGRCCPTRRCRTCRRAQRAFFLPSFATATYSYPSVS